MSAKDDGTRSQSTIIAALICAATAYAGWREGAGVALGFVLVVLCLYGNAFLVDRLAQGARGIRRHEAWRWVVAITANLAFAALVGSDAVLVVLTWLPAIAGWIASRVSADR